MERCLFCDRILTDRPRCQKCGWGQGRLPWQNSPWETTSFGMLSLAWFRTFWQLLESPRFFFESLNPHSKSWRSWSFGLPLVFLVFLMMILWLPRIVENLPQDLQEQVQFLMSNFLDPLSGLSLFSFVLESSLILVRWAALWLLIVAAATSLLQTGLLLSSVPSRSWFKTFRLMGYCLIPFPFMGLIDMLLQILNPQYGFPPPGSGLPILIWTFFSWVPGLIMIIWTYFLTLIALEEFHQISRQKAQRSLLWTIFLGFFIQLAVLQLF